MSLQALEVGVAEGHQHLGSLATLAHLGQFSFLKTQLWFSVLPGIWAAVE